MHLDSEVKMILELWCSPSEVNHTSLQCWRKEPRQLVLLSLTSNTLERTVGLALVPIVTAPGHGHCKPAAAAALQVWQQRPRLKPIHATLWSHIDSRCNKILFRNRLERGERVPPYTHVNSYNLTWFPLKNLSYTALITVVLRQGSPRELKGLVPLLSLLMPDRGGYLCPSYVCAFYFYCHERCFR